MPHLSQCIKQLTINYRNSSGNHAEVISSYINRYCCYKMLFDLEIDSVRPNSIGLNGRAMRSNFARFIFNELAKSREWNPSHQSIISGVVSFVVDKLARKHYVYSLWFSTFRTCVLWHSPCWLCTKFDRWSAHYESSHPRHSP